MIELDYEAASDGELILARTMPTQYRIIYPMDVVKRALGFEPSQGWIDEAMREYEDWHLPTLRDECSRLLCELMEVNTIQGRCTVNRMLAVIAIRTIGE